MNVRKRGLALLMCIWMIFTLLPFSAFADASSDKSVIYGKYVNGTWTQDAEATDTVTCKTEGDNTLSLTKTAKRTADNTYDITLKVVSTQTETTTKPGSAATVLVMDVSGSMDICATCNNSEQHRDLLGNYWYEHSENCKTWKTGPVQNSETRLKAAKDAACNFILSYSGAVLEDGKVTGLKDNAADGLGRYVSVVSFSDNASVACEWMDVSTVAGYNAAIKAIEGLSAGGGTNFEQGLSKAKSQLDNTTVKDIASKNVVALTDGKPTYSGAGPDYGNGKKCSKAVYTNTKAAATNLKKTGAKLYTVCFGAANEKIKEYDDGKEWYNHVDITVGDFLKNKIATPAAGGKTYAYNADNTTELMTAFKAITSSITEGIKTGTVLDPMGDHITVTSKPDNFVETANGYTWELGEPKSKVTENGKTTYTYELTYTVTFDPNFAEFHENNYYAANGVTTFTAGGEVYYFNVPGVKGTAPRYNVTYEYTGTVPTGAPELPKEASYKAGDPVEVAAAPTLNGYTFSGWSTTDATVGSDGSFTMPSNKVTLTGSWTLRSDLSYTVHYYWNGTNESVKADKVVTGQTFNTIVTEEPATVIGYTPVSNSAVELKIGTDTNANVITFYYYKNVTLTAEDRIVTYNGQEQTVNTGYDVVVKADNGKDFKLSGVEFRGVYASGTGKEVGEYAIDFVGETVGKTDTTAKYIVANTVKGTLTITPIDTVVVTIKGNTDTKVYNGAEQSVTGYTVKISDPKYTEADFKFTGDPKASRTDVGTTPMGLTANSFVNNNSNFKNVTFVVEEDGYLTITKRPLTIEGQSSEPITYDGQTHSFMDWWPVTATDNTGLVSGHEVSGISYLLTGKDADSYTGEFTGTAKVMAGEVDVTGNYDIEYAPGEMLIEPAEKIVIKITGNTATETYDGTEKSVTGYTTDVKDSSITVKLKEGKAATAKGTNVGKYMMGLEAADFDVTSTNYSKIEVLVEDGYLDITPITDEVVVTITGHKDEFTYDGKEHTVKGYDTSISNQLYNATDFTFTGKAEVSRTEVGHSEMGLKNDQFQNVSTNFTNVKFVINDGGITIKERPYRPNPSITDKITVEITGNSDSVVYDGTEHSVKDYTVKISDSRYTEKDFTFSGKALASGINAGTYEMGLKADQFKNTNARFKNVEFIIKADGVLTITQRPLTITAGSAEGIAPVTCDKYTVEGLATGDKVDSVKLTGIQSEPGESPNVASDAVIKNAKGEDVTANYKITYVDGVLKAIEVLNKEIHFNYVIGYTDGTIRPNNDISRAEVATIFFRLLTDEAREQYTTTAGNFTDVKAGMWCNRAIATLTNMGIIKGYTDGSFQPNKSITRAELATIIARFAKLDVNTKTFSDITGHWAQKNIELAAGNGWINGYEDGTFRPNNNITRAETFAMINRVLDRQTESVSDLLPTSDMNMWSDNLNENAWYYKDVQEATNYHKCDRVGDSVYEKWTEKVPDIDWASYQI